jgi:hypothetical protein
MSKAHHQELISLVISRDWLLAQSLLYLCSGGCDGSNETMDDERDELG